MTNDTLVGRWVRRFLVEHIVGERNLALNTQRSYRDTISLLMPFAARKIGKSVDKLRIEEISADLVRLFLVDVEESRGCSISTRNQRLSAIHAFARFVGQRSPEQIAWCGEIRAIPFRKMAKAEVHYLDKPEMNALLSSPNSQTTQGRRDHALLLFLYNSGARADEAAHVTVVDLALTPSPSVKLRGKGNKERSCPLWPSTARELAALVENRAPQEPVFLNRCGKAITRFGIHAMVERYVLRTKDRVPSIRTKRVSPHTIRHTTAMHLLRSGVDINTIRAWLGHVSIDTTNVYAESDLQMKAEALAKCQIDGDAIPAKHWREVPSLMDFLGSL